MKKDRIGFYIVLMLNVLNIGIVYSSPEIEILRFAKAGEENVWLDPGYFGKPLACINLDYDNDFLGSNPKEQVIAKCELILKSVTSIPLFSDISFVETSVIAGDLVFCSSGLFYEKRDSTDGINHFDRITFELTFIRQLSRKITISLSNETKQHLNFDFFLKVKADPEFISGKDDPFFGKKNVMINHRERVTLEGIRNAKNISAILLKKDMRQITPNPFANLSTSESSITFDIVAVDRNIFEDAMKVYFKTYDFKDIDSRKNFADLFQIVNPELLPSSISVDGTLSDKLYATHESQNVTVAFKIPREHQDISLHYRGNTFPGNRLLATETVEFKDVVIPPDQTYGYEKVEIYSGGSKLYETVLFFNKYHCPISNQNKEFVKMGVNDRTPVYFTDRISNLNEEIEMLKFIFDNTAFNCGAQVLKITCQFTDLAGKTTLCDEKPVLVSEGTSTEVPYRIEINGNKRAIEKWNRIRITIEPEWDQYDRLIKHTKSEYIRTRELTNNGKSFGCLKNWKSQLAFELFGYNSAYFKEFKPLHSFLNVGLTYVARPVNEKGEIENFGIGVGLGLLNLSNAFADSVKFGLGFSPELLFQWRIGDVHITPYAGYGFYMMDNSITSEDGVVNKQKTIKGAFNAGVFLNVSIAPLGF